MACILIPLIARMNDTLNNYFIELGIPTVVFLDIPLSRFTFENALLAKPILASANISHAILFSSEFHMQRAHYIFNHVLPTLNLTLVSTKAPLPVIKLSQLYGH